MRVQLCTPRSGACILNEVRDSLFRAMLTCLEHSIHFIGLADHSSRRTRASATTAQALLAKIADGNISDGDFSDDEAEDITDASVSVFSTST